MATPWHMKLGTWRKVVGLSRLDLWLVGAVALGAWLRFTRLGEFDNQYYTATVVSMLQSPKSFLFASFDPLGIVTVDKPPLSFWIQAAPVALLGPSRWAVSLPQAVGGTLSIVLLYLAMKPAFGRVAAVVAACLLAVFPASVVIDSRNEPDSLLSFTLLLAAVLIVLAAQTGRWLWIMLFAFLMGLAFNIKMLVAFVPLPAFLAYYLLASRQPLKWVVVRASLALAILFVVSFSWAAVVALTPAGDRPYVGSTRDNSMWTLVFRYNGLDRFTSFGGPRPRQPLAQPAQGTPQGVPAPQGPLPPGPSQVGLPQVQSPPVPSNVADLGLLGLFTTRLVQQTGWLLPLALLAIAAAMVPMLTEEVYTHPRSFFTALRVNPVAAQSLLWIGWFATALIVFGLADSTTTHPYYLVGLAVPMAAVTGRGLAVLWDAYVQRGMWAWVVPMVLAGTVLYQVMGASGAVADWIAAVALIAMFLVVLGLGVAIGRRATTSRLARGFLVMSVLAVLVIPAAFAPGFGGPIAGANVGPGRAPGPPRSDPQTERVSSTASVMQRLDGGGSVVALGTVSAREAAPFIIKGVPAMAIGGFSGSDPIFTPASFTAMAERGEIRYFLMPDARAPGGPGGPGGPGFQEAILRGIRQSWEDVSRAAGLPPGSLYRFPGAGAAP